MRLCRLAVLLISLCVPVSISHAAQIHVDDDAAGDPGPGDPTISDPLEDGSPAHPFDAVQEAITAALPGDEVLLADGVYAGVGNREITLEGKAIIVRSMNGAENCIIDAENPDGHSEGFLLLAGEDDDTILWGLTIRGATTGVLCDGSAPTIIACVLAENDQGGVECDTASPTFLDCVIENNHHGGWGGGGAGAYCHHGSAPEFVRCRFSTNACVSGSMARGGGAYCIDCTPTFAHCLFEDNLIEANHIGALGGAVCLIDCDAKFASCEFRGNMAASREQRSRGGGVYCFGQGNSRFDHCLFENNTCVLDQTAFHGSTAGGGVCCEEYAVVRFANCTFLDNRALSNVTSEITSLGGGVAIQDDADVTLTDCLLAGNSADYGGGVGIQSCSSVIALVTTRMVDNLALSAGGGCYIEDCTPLLINCDVVGNRVNPDESHGGGFPRGAGIGLRDVPFSMLIQCVITGNALPLDADEGHGGGVYLYSSEPLLAGCVVSGNRTGDIGGGLFCAWSAAATLHNCIVTQNTPDQFEIESGGEVSVAFSVVEGGWEGPGNLGVDPMFVDPGHWDDAGTPADPADDIWINGDYRLQHDSPCIDAGDSTAVPPDVLDLDDDGNVNEHMPFDRDRAARFRDDPQVIDTGIPDGGLPIVDIGAYERPGFALGDMNCDGTVGYADIQPFIKALAGIDVYEALFPECEYLNGDCDQDGLVSYDDIAPFVTLIAR